MIIIWHEVNVALFCRYIGMSVYNVFILCIIGAPISLAMREQPDASFSIVSVCIIICTSITQCLVFIPKVSVLSSHHYWNYNQLFVCSIVFVFCSHLRIWGSSTYFFITLFSHFQYSLILIEQLNNFESKKVTHTQKLFYLKISVRAWELNSLGEESAMDLMWRGKSKDFLGFEMFGSGIFGGGR